MGSRDDFLEAVAAGGAVPAVDPGDLKRLWRFGERVRMTTGRDTVVGIDTGSLGQDFPPGAPINGVWFRVGMLDILVRQGLLR